jgi:hypothetical protein
MWIRGIVRARPVAGGGEPKAIRALIADLDSAAKRAGAHFDPQAADRAWADAGWVKRVIEARKADAKQRVPRGGLVVAADRLGALTDALDAINMDFLPDFAIGPADVWTPYAPGGALFGTRDDALRLIHAPAPFQSGLGAGVNVAIVDYGVDFRWMQRECRRFDRHIDRINGWPRYLPLPGGAKEWIAPGDTPPSGLTHGQMIARNILAIAPGATIWDIPLLPDTAVGPPRISMAEAILHYVRVDLAAGELEDRTHEERLQADRGGKAGCKGSWQPVPVGLNKPWILVNAWGALDPRRFDFFFDTAAGAGRAGRRNVPFWNNRRHFFLRAMQDLSNSGIDVVFAAGNCGTPGAHPRCGETALGAGRSIHGLNAHAAVLTVGAVRSDGVAIGGSAHGPGVLAFPPGVQPRPGRNDRYDPAVDAPSQDPRGDSFLQKPDICAPSYFHETEGDGLVNTGTSAACGIAAGVLAAMRSVEVKNGQKRKKPEEIRAILRETARQPDGGSPRWDPRTGWGIIDFEAAKGRL